ncbi:aldo/keto reductase [Frondihabitans sucicola]|nr:aldo/keto reductase [Frondihabitans sucicola]
MTSLPTKTFGRTGFEVSPLCIGTSAWGRTRADETEERGDARIAEIASSWASGSIGLNFLDTSNEYGDARSELLIGRGLASASAVAAGDIADGLVLQTKLDRDVATGDFSADRMWRSSRSRCRAWESTACRSCTCTTPTASGSTRPWRTEGRCPRSWP